MKKKSLLILICLLAFSLRLNNFNWDQGFHLHPDERFLTMVGNAMKIVSLPNYFDPQLSTLNPTNIGYRFFVYGTFPIIFNKIAAVLLGNDNYNFFTLQGRFLSALFDVLTLITVFKLMEFLEKKIKIHASLKYWGAFFYGISVLPIQLSHFFAVDTFLTFFTFASCYFAIKYYFDSQNHNLFLSGLFLSFALASKISAIYIAPLEGILILAIFLKQKKPYISRIIPLLIYGLIAYFALRVVAPYYFEKASFLNPFPNKLFMANLTSLKSFEDPNGFYPPGIQWLSKGPLFALFNLALFGLGLPYFIFLILGVIYLFICEKNKKIKDKQLFLMILLWVLVFFVFQSFQFVKAMRYFILLYPFLAIISAFGADWFLSRAKSYWLLLLSLILVLIWPIAFSSIYLQKNSRIQASEWIYQNIPGDKILLNEHWDDPLPLLLEENHGKNFKGEMMPVFYPDTHEKWREINSLLAGSDYYILSSNRGWGSISKVPQKYPLMSKFYADLFAGRLQYKKVKEFTSYPGIFSISIPDDVADESFTVYDHPRVIIYKKIVQ